MLLLDKLVATIFSATVLYTDVKLSPYWLFYINDKWPELINFRLHANFCCTNCFMIPMQRVVSISHRCCKRKSIFHTPDSMIFKSKSGALWVSLERMLNVEVFVSRHMVTRKACVMNIRGMCVGKSLVWTLIWIFTWRSWAECGWKTRFPFVKQHGTLNQTPLSFHSWQV